LNGKEKPSRFKTHSGKNNRSFKKYDLIVGKERKNEEIEEKLQEAKDSTDEA